MTKKILTILIIVGFVVYFNSLFNGFLWDDEEYIVNSPSIKSIKNIPMFFTGKEHVSGTNIQKNTTYYRPLASVIYSILFLISGGHPISFRLFQVVVHIINSILVFFIFFHFFNRTKHLPFFLSMIFLVHPINSEAVLFISATQEVLFFLLGSLVFFIFY